MWRKLTLLAILINTNCAFASVEESGLLNIVANIQSLTQALNIENDASYRKTLCTEDLSTAVIQTQNFYDRSQSELASKLELDLLDQSMSVLAVLVQQCSKQESPITESK